MTGLTFETLRAANLSRIPEYKNPKGEPAHTEPDGSDWSLNDWCVALMGELGELANMFKKIRRGDYTLEERSKDIANELADIQTYLDITAYQCGVNLGEATIDKFNEVSIRVGAETKIARGGEFIYR